jgi:hypothetical protein
MNPMNYLFNRNNRGVTIKDDDHETYGVPASTEK